MTTEGKAVDLTLDKQWPNTFKKKSMANTFLDRGRIFEVDSATVTQAIYLEYIYYPL